MLGVDGRSRLHNIEIPEGFRGGHLRAPNVVEHAATQIDRSRVIEPVVLVDRAGGVVHLKRGVVDAEVRGAGETGRIPHQSDATRDEDITGGGAVGEKGQGVWPGALEGDRTSDIAGKVAVIGVQILDKGRTNATSDVAAAVESGATVKETGGLGSAIEVQGAALVDVEVVVEKESVIATVHPQGALVDDRLAAGDVAAHTWDNTGGGLEGEDAVARLDEGDVSASLTYTALEQAGDGGVVRGEAGGVNGERRAGGQVGEDTAADAGVAGQGKNTTALDRKDVERFHGEAAATLQGKGVETAGIDGRRGGGEADVGIDRQSVRDHFRADDKRAQDPGGGGGGGEGCTDTRVGRIDEGPGNDTLVGRARSTGLTDEGEARCRRGNGRDVGTRCASETEAAEQSRRTRGRGRGIDRGRWVVWSAEDEGGGLAGTRGDGDGAMAACKGRRGDGLGGGPGSAADDIEIATGKSDRAGGAEAVARVGAGVVERQGGSGVDSDRARATKNPRAIDCEGARVDGDCADERGVGDAQGRGAGADFRDPGDVGVQSGGDEGVARPCESQAEGTGNARNSAKRQGPRIRTDRRGAGQGDGTGPGVVSGDVLQRASGVDTGVVQGQRFRRIGDVGTTQLQGGTNEVTDGGRTGGCSERICIGDIDRPCIDQGSACEVLAGTDGQGPVVSLDEPGGIGDRIGTGKRECLTSDHFNEVVGRGGVGEADGSRAAERCGTDRADCGGRAVDGEGVGGVAKSPIAAEGQGAARHADIAGEGIPGIAEDESAGAGLGKGESSVHHAGERQTLDHVGGLGAADAEGGVADKGGGTGELESVAVARSDGEGVGSAGIQGAELNRLVEGGAARETRQTRAIHGDGAVSGEGHIVAENDVLTIAKAVAVIAKVERTATAEGDGIGKAAVGGGGGEGEIAPRDRNAAGEGVGPAEDPSARAGLGDGGGIGSLISEDGEKDVVADAGAGEGQGAGAGAAERHRADVA